MNRYEFNILCSIGINSVIFYAIYLLGQSDPKGIVFGIYTFGYGCLCGLTSIVLLSLKHSSTKFFYSVVMIGNCIFFYYLFVVVEEYYYHSSLFQYNFFHFTIIFGCLLFLTMLGKMILYEKSNC
jgi:hypothetical protein